MTHRPGIATYVSPWHDSLRHRYEARVTITRLAQDEDVTRDQMILWLRMAGTKFRVKPYVTKPRKRALTWKGNQDEQ